jgi:6-methylsalicylate decarboxylase
VSSGPTHDGIHPGQAGDGLVDVHLHAMPTRYKAALQQALGPSARTPDWSPEQALEMMDRHHIEAAVLSLSAPGVHFGDDARARELARALNDEAAEISARYPRLGSFATLPLPDTESACTEAIRALDVLGLDGVAILTSYAGCYLGHPSYDPLLEVLDAHEATVFVHPAVHPSMDQVDIGVPRFMLEYPFETTRAAVNMIFADVLERFPRVRFILSHGGGTLPYLSWRIATIAMRQLSQPPAHERGLRDRYPTPLTTRRETVTADSVKRLMRRFYFDVALTADPSGLGALVAFADPSRILFGSDWPYAHEQIVADEMCSINDETVVPVTARVRIGRANAAALFPRLAGLDASRPLTMQGGR